MKSFLKKLLFGSVLLETENSPVNGQIVVLEDLFNRREMVAGGVEQSGVLVKKVWRRVLNPKFLILKQKIRRDFKCLILGLGGGTIAQLISEKFPEAEMVGIELDSKVIKLGQKYFNLGEISNLEIILGDAFEKIQDLKIGNYDLILVDLYCGREFPVEAESEKFLKIIKKLLTPDGLAVFNRLNYRKEHYQKNRFFAQKLAEFFPAMGEIKAEFNRLFWVSSALSK